MVSFGYKGPSHCRLVFQPSTCKHANTHTDIQTIALRDSNEDPLRVRLSLRRLDNLVVWSGIPTLEGSFAGSSAAMGMARPLRDWSIDEKTDRDHLMRMDNPTIRKNN